MFDYESIKKLTADDVLILNGLSELAKKAKEAAEIVKDTYLFHIGEEKIEVWRDEYNHEYLTCDGVWQARYLHQNYDVKCTAETIFEYMKAEFLIEKGFAKEYDGNLYTKEGEMVQAFRYFKVFLKNTEDMHKS